MKWMLCALVLVVAGCAGKLTYYPACEAVLLTDNNGGVPAYSMKTPCLGYSNGKKMGPNRQSLAGEGPVYPAVVLIDEHGKYRAVP